MKKILFLLLTAISIGATAQQVVSTTVKFNNNVTFNDSTFGNPTKVPVTTFEDTVRITRGAGAGKILASDANGNAYWTNSSSVDTLNGTPVFPSGIKTDTIFTTGGTTTGQVLILINDTTGVFANAPFWKLTGNAGTNPNTNFVGTTDAKKLFIGANGNRNIMVDTNAIIGVYQYEWLDSVLGLFNFRKFYNVAAYSSANSLISVNVTGDKNITNNITSLTTGRVVGTIIDVDTTNGEYHSQSFYNDTATRFQVGAWHQPQFSDSDYTELSVFNLGTQADRSKFRLYVQQPSDYPAAMLHIDDSTVTARYIYYVNNKVLPDSGVWQLGTGNNIWKGVATNTLYIPISAGTGKVLTSDANGVASWQEPDSLLPYRKYVALISQIDVDSMPVAIVLENTLGAIEWSVTSAGSITGELNGAFTENKTFVTYTPRTDSADCNGYVYEFSSDDFINIKYLGSGCISRNSSIEIRVYK